MPKQKNRLQPHREKDKGINKNKGFDIDKAFEQKKLNHHVLFGILGALFGNKIIAAIYLYHQYKVHLLLDGLNEENTGKEHSYYVRLCILREFTIITICFRLFLLVMFCIGLYDAFQKLRMI